MNIKARVSGCLSIAFAATAIPLIGVYVSEVADLREGGLVVFIVVQFLLVVIGAGLAIAPALLAFGDPSLLRYTPIAYLLALVVWGGLATVVGWERVLLAGSPLFSGAILAGVLTAHLIVPKPIRRRRSNDGVLAENGLAERSTDHSAKR